MKDSKELRQECIDIALKMNKVGVNQGMSGNISVRVDGGMLITPSGMDYESLLPDDIVFMDSEGSVAQDGRKPSSEWRFHLDIYNQRNDVGAIVHTHSTCATSISCQGIDIPAFHYMVAIAGGDNIRCAEYATYGSQELSDAALRALENRKACLLAHHGVISTGSTLKRALDLAVEVETLAAQYINVCQLGEPKLLTKNQMNEVIKKFKSYGSKAQE